MWHVFLLQEAFHHKTHGCIQLTTARHDFLNDIWWIVDPLATRHTHLHEIVPECQPYVMGASDTSGLGMGGVFFLPSLMVLSCICGGHPFLPLSLQT